MPQMTNAAARVIDPILTEVAQGYKNADMVGMALFPYVPVAQRGGKIITFGKEAFRLYNTGRTPGSGTCRWFETPGPEIRPRTLIFIPSPRGRGLG